MVSRNTLTVVTVAATVLFSTTPRSSSAAPALTLSSFSLWSSDPPLTLGYSFRVNAADIQVFALGYFDDEGNGFTESHPVGLWDNSGTLLASITLSAGTSNPLIDNYRYANLTAPITLSSNQTYTVAGLYVNDRTYAYSGSATDFSVNPAITYDMGRFAVSNSLTYPTTTNHLFYGGGSFFINSPVPAPSSVMAFVIGTVPGAVMLLRRRRKA